MSPIQPQSDNSYTGVVNIPNCPDGTCPGILSLSRPASDIGDSVSLCQIDTSQCVGNVCKSSPECGLAAITAPKPDGSTQVTYTVSPKASGAFQMEYASEGRLATARYGLPPSPPGEDIATSKRGKRDTVECRDMAITNNGIAYIPQVPKNDPSYVYEQFGVIPSNLPYNRDREGGAVTFSNAAVRVANSPCNPVYRVYRWFGFSGYGRHLYWRENNPEIVNCIGGESGVRIPPGIRFSDGMEGMQPFNISSDDRCSPPDSAAYNCPDSKAFAPPSNTPANPLYLPGIPKGRWNTALRGINPNAVVTNSDGTYVRWGAYVDNLRHAYPNARCEGDNKGQPNAGFLNIFNLVERYYDEANQNPGLDCTAANAFTVSPNTPANPLNINNIPLDEFNQALNGTDPDALVTNGQGQFVRWEEFVTSIKNLFPNALCTGELASQPNAEFLHTAGPLTRHMAQPGLAAQRQMLSRFPPIRRLPLNLTDISLVRLLNESRCNH